jgi:hypothetical protein
MTRRVGAVAVLIALTAASAGAIAATNRGGANGRAATAAPEPTAQAAKKPIEFDANDLFIETNQTDGDAGLQMKLDGEKWRQLKVHDPKGRKVMMEAKGKGRLRNWGLTELFFETDEPPFDNFPFSKFKKRFPEGKYTFTGRTVGGRKMVGSDRFSHLVPDGPVVTSPTEGEQVDPNAFTVSWEPVTTPDGLEIVRYIVVVTQEDPERELSMDLLPGATSASIPAQFLNPSSETEVEVLAREKSGNQTITEVQFATK